MPTPLTVTTAPKFFFCWWVSQGYCQLRNRYWGLARPTPWLWRKLPFSEPFPKEWPVHGNTIYRYLPRARDTSTGISTSLGLLSSVDADGGPCALLLSYNGISVQPLSSAIFLFILIFVEKEIPDKVGILHHPIDNLGSFIIAFWSKKSSSAKAMEEVLVLPT